MYQHNDIRHNITTTLYQDRTRCGGVAIGEIIMLLLRWLSDGIENSENVRDSTRYRLLLDKPRRSVFIVYSAAVCIILYTTVDIRVIMTPCRSTSNLLGCCKALAFEKWYFESFNNRTHILIWYYYYILCSMCTEDITHPWIYGVFRSSVFRESHFNFLAGLFSSRI